MLVSPGPEGAKGGRNLSADDGARIGILRLPLDAHHQTPSAAASEVTQLLLSWRAGDEGALERLLPVVEPELRRIARRCMRGERAGRTLQPTALVNEAYLRLVDLRQMRWQDRAHFLAMAARLMRRILVDAARARGSKKRGAAGQRVTLDDALAASDEGFDDMIAIDTALTALAAIDSRKARGVELRVFGGLTFEEAAEVLDVSPETVVRDWKFAKAWLARALSPGS